MRQTTRPSQGDDYTMTFMTLPGGTEVIFTAEDVPAGIRPEDHQLGMTSTLDNLAAFTEK